MTERRLPSRFRDGVMSFVDPRRVPAGEFTDDPESAV